MLRQLTDIAGLVVAARDGELGKVRDFYFDDSQWGIRHIEIDTGGWLTGRRVLLAPQCVQSFDWIENRIHVSLTREQVEDSPPVSANQPVSREQEASLYLHYGYPVYWSGPGPFAAGGLPMAPGLAAPPGQAVAKEPPLFEVENRRAMESARDEAGSLRSCKEVLGYGIAATDGDIGHLDDFLFDDEEWAIRYLVIDTRNWLPGKRVPLSVRWIDSISWPEEKIFVDIARERIESSPEYLGRLDRDYEALLHEHYGRATYWGDRSAGATDRS